MIARVRAACVLAIVVATCATQVRVGAADVAAPPPTALFVRGHVLAIGRGFVVFDSGAALRLRNGTPVPAGITLGSAIEITLDPTSREIIAILREPKTMHAYAIDIKDVPADDLVGTSAEPRASLPGLGASAAAALGIATVTLTVTVPANTPPTDDVYVATDRSNFSPSEIRMQRVGARRFVTTLGVSGDARLRYEFTRGTYATVERDRSGGIVEPHVLDFGAGKTIETSVTRWADLD